MLSHQLVQSLDADAFGDDAVLGCDFVGTVERTGDKVSRVKAGTVIAGLIWGGQSPILDQTYSIQDINLRSSR